MNAILEHPANRQNELSKIWQRIKAAFVPDEEALLKWTLRRETPYDSSPYEKQRVLLYYFDQRVL